LAGDLGDIGEQLFVWFFGSKVLLNQVFRLFRLRIRRCRAGSAALGPDRQMVLPADPVNAPGATRVVSLLPQPADDPPNAIVGVLRLLAQALVDLLQQLPIPERSVRA